MATLSHRLEKELIVRGLVPDGCRFMSLKVEAGLPIAIQLLKYPNADEINRLGDALKAAAADDAK